MLKKISDKNYIIYLILILVYLIFSITYSPIFLDLGYDKEIFQYIGMTIKNNLRPYTDTFDHKPPVIYLLNYLGVILTPNSTWGIYLILNVVGLSCSLLIYHLSLKKSKNLILSILITILFISFINNNSLLQGGNLTRQITTFLNTIILFIIFGTKKSKFNFVFLGLLIGVIFFTQQNEILGGSFLIVYYILFEKDFDFSSLKNKMLNIGYFMLGLSIPFISMLFIINYWNNFDDFINQVFLFNFSSYINKDSFLKKALKVCYRLLHYKLLIGILFLSLINLIYIIIKDKKVKITTPLAVITISLILQIISTSMSGKLYGHYFLMFVPYVICILIFTIKYKTNKYLDLCLYSLVILITVSTIRLRPYKKPDKKLLTLLNNKISPEKNIPGQFYTFEPNYLRINFNLNINSPSKYVYSHFFNKKDYNKLIKDFKKNNTKYILYKKKKIIPKKLMTYLTSNYNEAIKYNDYVLYQNNNFY